jgi:N utilization substance protein B
MSNRRLAREVLVQSLYEAQLSNVDPRLALRSNLQRRNGGDDVQEFAQRVLKELLEHRTRVDDLIKAALVNWTWERIAVVDRCVLEMAVVELMRFPDVPVSVVIDEAIVIARKFGSEDSGKFVNGVLDRIARQLGETPDTAQTDS